MNASHILSPLAALFFTYFLIPILRKLAIRLQLVDNPNFRKVHQKSVPLIGGISIFLSTSMAITLTLPINIEIFEYKNVFIASFILLMIGVIDDRFELRASLKLGIQLILAHIIFMQGIKIESFYGLLGVYELTPGMQYSITVLVIAGVVNAFNLMDGIDGLAAGVTILGLIVLSIMAFLVGQLAITLIFATIISSLLIFLRFNLSQHQKIFMGDAGSLFLGFLLVVLGISILQSAQNSKYLTMTAFAVIAVMLVPVLDALRVFRNRIKSGKSPFKADKTHLHHLILTFGLKHKLATFAILGLIVLIMLVGYLSFEFLGLNISIISMLLVFYTFTSVLELNNDLKHWKIRIQSMERGGAKI